jgi:hypothetical protein
MLGIVKLHISWRKHRKCGDLSITDISTQFRNFTHLPAQLQTKPSGSFLVELLPWTSVLYSPGTCNMHRVYPNGFGCLNRGI